MRISRTKFAVATLIAACTFAAQTAMAANPVYDSWAKHQPGTMVQMHMVTEANGQKTEMDQTFTLKSVTPEKVVVEMAASMMMMGNKVDMPAQSMDIPAGAAAAAPTTPGAAPATPAPDSKTTEETVTVAGKEYKATVTSSNSDSNGMKTMSKVWMTPEVPGGTVKMEATTEGAVASHMVSEVTKIETK